MEPILTPEEQELIRKVKQAGGTIEDAQRAIIAKQEGRESPLVAPRRPSPVQEGYTMKETVTDVAETVSRMAESLKTGYQRGREVYDPYVDKVMAGQQPTLKEAATTGAQMFTAATAGAFNTLWDAFLGAGKVAVTGEREQKIKSGFEGMLEPVVNQPWMQENIQAYKWLEENDPQEFRKVRSLIEGIQIATDVTGVRLGGEAGGLLKRGVQEGVEVAGEALTRAPQSAIRTGTKATTGGVLGGGVAVTEEVIDYAKRATQHIQEGMASAQARRQAISEAASPQIQQAMKVNVPERQINLVTTADDATTKAFQDMLYAYEGANADAVTKLYSEAGEQMLGTVEKKMRQVGEDLGRAIDTLPKATVDMRPAQQQVIKLLEENGIQVFKQPSGRITYDFGVNGPSAFTDAQQQYIKTAVETMLKYDQLNSQGIHSADRFFGNLANQFYADPNVRGLYLQVNGVDQSFLPLMRQLYRSPLDTITEGNISALNRQYAQYRKLVDAANETIFNAGKDLGIQMDIGAPLQTNLRRIFSNAKSRAQFATVLEQLTRVARENGYNGPDLKSMADFDLYVQKLYPEEAIPAGSFAGQIRAGIGGGVLGKIEKFLSAGEPTIVDQRNALKGLLNADIPRTPDVPPSTTAVPPTTTQPPTKGNQPVSSTNTTTKPGLVDKAKGAVKQFGEDMKNEDGFMKNPFSGGGASIKTSATERALLADIVTKVSKNQKVPLEVMDKLYKWADKNGLRLPGGRKEIAGYLKDVLKSTS